MAGRQRSLRLSLAAALAALLTSISGAAAKSLVIDSEPVILAEVSEQAIPLDATGLTFLSGLVLSSADNRLGGLSGLLVSPDGRHMTAVSDRGHWLTATLVHDDAGRLEGVGEATMGRLRGLDGTPLRQKRWADAESLARAGDEGTLVAFEQDHRLWRYRDLNGKPEPFPSPAGLQETARNHGLEAVTRLADGRLLALAEGEETDGTVPGWVADGDGWQRLDYAVDHGFVPTGAATLPDGDALVVERRFHPLAGLAARLRRVAAATVEAGTVLRPETVSAIADPLPVDNFEGIAVREDAGRTLVYVVSDDNFNPIQRTLLLQFELEPRQGKTRSN